METIKDYHNMYLKCDVLLLADICEKSKNCSLKNIDCVWLIIWAHQV